MRIRLLVSYHGGAYFGWQRQAEGPSVQAALEDAAEVIHQRHVRIQGASRTDSGVHALGQVAVFDTELERPAWAWRKSLDQLTDATVRVRAAERCSDDFDPRHDARGKSYHYYLWDAPPSSPFFEGTVWSVRTPIDVEKMAEGASYLVGEHDFNAFRAARCQARTAVRRITECTAVRTRDGRIRIEVTGNAFLMHMVRIIVGALVEVGRGYHEPAWIRELLSSRDRTLGSRTAPAQGLFLSRIYYPGGVFAGARVPERELF